MKTTRGMLLALSAAVAVLMSGCATYHHHHHRPRGHRHHYESGHSTGAAIYLSMKLSESHPANPQAAASSQSIARPMLMAGAQGLVLPLSTNQTEMQHGQHQPAPAGKGVQKPAEQKHEHGQPKGKAEKK